MESKSMWIKSASVCFLFSLLLMPACYADKKQPEVKEATKGEGYKGWISLTFDNKADKEVFSLRLPPNTEGIECENLRKEKGRIICANYSDEIWMRWKSDAVPNRFLHIGIESYETDKMNLKGSMIEFNLGAWKKDTISTFSKPYNGRVLYFRDVVDPRFSDADPIRRRRVVSFETKNKFFANFSFAESDGQGASAKSVPQKEWKLEPVVEKILESITFAKDLGESVVLPK